MNQSKKNVIWRGFFLELKCISVFIIDLTTGQNGQIPHFPKFTSKKTVVQLKNNLHKLFCRSEMEISEVDCHNFASYEQKMYQLVSPNLQVHCQNICATKNISPNDKRILHMTKRSYTITNPKQHWFLTILESSSFSSPYRFLDWSHPAWKEHNISKY